MILYCSKVSVGTSEEFEKFISKKLAVQRKREVEWLFIYVDLTVGTDITSTQELAESNPKILHLAPNKLNTYPCI